MSHSFKTTEILGLLLLAAGLALPQTQTAQVYGKVTVEGPAISKALFGKAAAKVEQAVIYACASGGTVTVQPADFYINISGVAPMSTTDALAILQQSYGSQTAQKWARDLGVAAGSIGFAVSGGLLSGLSVKALGFFLGGTTLLNQEIIPSITATSPQLSALVSGTLDQIGAQTLTPGGPCLSAKFYMATPPKGTTYPLEATFSFTPGAGPVGVPATLHHVALRGDAARTVKSHNALHAEMEHDFATLADPADRDKLIAKWARIAGQQ